MSEYPKVYGYCDAGCKRRVVPYEEMAESGAMKPVDLGDGTSITVDVMDFDYFVIVNEGTGYKDLYTLNNVDKSPNVPELYAQGYWVKMSGNSSYAVGVHFTKNDDGTYTADVQYSYNAGDWASMKFTKIYGFKRLPSEGDE